MLTFDTTDGAENLVASYRLTVDDASDGCDIRERDAR